MNIVRATTTTGRGVRQFVLALQQADLVGHEADLVDRRLRRGER